VGNLLDLPHHRQRLLGQSRTLYFSSASLLAGTLCGLPFVTPWTYSRYCVMPPLRGFHS